MYKAAFVLIALVGCSANKGRDAGQAVAALVQASGHLADDPQYNQELRATLLAGACGTIPSCRRRCSAQDIQSYTHVNPRDRHGYLSSCDGFEAKRDTDELRWLTQRMVGVAEAGRSALTKIQVEQLACARSALGIDSPALAASPACDGVLRAQQVARRRTPGGGNALLRLMAPKVLPDGGPNRPRER